MTANKPVTMIMNYTGSAPDISSDFPEAYYTYVMTFFKAEVWGKGASIQGNTVTSNIRTGFSTYVMNLNMLDRESYEKITEELQKTRTAVEVRDVVNKVSENKIVFDNPAIVSIVGFPGVLQAKKDLTP